MSKISGIQNLQNRDEKRCSVARRERYEALKGKNIFDTWPIYEDHKEEIIESLIHYMCSELYLIIPLEEEMKEAFKKMDLNSYGSITFTEIVANILANLDDESE